tara:strand:+ start:97 stop:1020 length:924 start_codon:yes stop_codon:yes gene_type:complete
MFPCYKLIKPDSTIENYPRIDNNKHKNIFLGSPVKEYYENILDDDIYMKYNLNKKKKYVLFLFPKSPGGFYINESGKLLDTFCGNSKICTVDTCDKVGVKYNDLEKLYKYLKKMGYTIITKYRGIKEELLRCLNDKSNIRKYEISNELIKLSNIGDELIISYGFPNDTLLLMKICDLAISFKNGGMSFGSGMTEERILSKIPYIEFEVACKHVQQEDTNKDLGLYNEKCIQYVSDWKKNLTYEKFKEIHNKLDKKGSPVYDEMKKKISDGNCSEKIIDFVLSKKINQHNCTEICGCGCNKKKGEIKH